MKAKKILSGEISNMKISSLPTRPTAPTSLGGAGYTSAQMREAFDKLSLFIIQHYNDLIEDIENGEIAYTIPSGIDADHTVGDLVNDVKNGNFAAYLNVGGASLMTTLAELDERIQALEAMK